MGEARHPSRLSRRAHRAGRVRRCLFLRQDGIPSPALFACRRSAPGSRRQRGAPRCAPRDRRRGDAAGLRQRRRLRRRGHDGRQSRVGRIVRPDRQARAPLRRRAGRWRARTGGRAAGDRRGRGVRGRVGRSVRGHPGAPARGARERRRAHRIDHDLRPGPRSRVAGRGAGGRSGRAGLAPGARRVRPRARPAARDAGDREVPRRPHRRRDGARRLRFASRAPHDPSPFGATISGRRPHRRDSSFTDPHSQ